ncbi:capsule biosynthesis protein [Hahella sp. CR1]|uniref:GumC family protein n=1 Tax=Hahella sp. CR1 TaxID=2992807 RepID=UPI00244270BC|nr:capsule biosynthesis protein [Hahella sp. CR1]MDG9672226.1 capsule biosynthesis protein [Hahella sp. CR1]
MRVGVFLNLHYMAAAAWRRRYAIVAPLLAAPFLALLIGAVTPKKYQSYTTLLIQETSKLNPFLADFSVSTQLKERMAALQALLHSRHMLGEVAMEMGLGDKDSGRIGDPVLNRLSHSLKVELIGSDIIKISLTDSSPHDMARTLEVTSKHFLNVLLAPERSSIDASENFLEEQLLAQQQALLAAENTLATFKSQYSGNLPGQMHFDIEQLRETEKQLQIKQVELAGADAAIETLNTQLLKANPLLASIEADIIRASAELNQLQARYTDKHSLVVAARHSLQRLRQERDTLVTQTRRMSPQNIDELWRLAAEFADAGEDRSATGSRVSPLLVSQLESIQQAQSRQQQLTQETASLQQTLTRLKTKLDSFAQVEQRLRELERDIVTKQHIYDDLLKRYEMAKVTGALGRFEEHDRVKIIDRPFTPHAPINLPLVVYFISGALGGLFLGAAIAVILEIIDTSIIRRDVAEKIIGAPVISRLPDFRQVAIGFQSARDLTPVES